MGAPFNVKISKKDLERMKYNPVEIAKMEFEKDLIPISVNRKSPQERAAKQDAKV